jgi:hypothetical protein
VTRYVRIALLLVVTVVVAIVVSRLDMAAIRGVFAAMRWRWAAGAAAANLAGVLIDAIRWRIIVSGVSEISLTSSIQALFAGLIGNVLFPFKLGEGIRAYLLASREQLPTATVLTTVALDRAVDVATLPLFVVVASALMPLPASVLRIRAWALLLVAALAAGSAGVTRWVRTRRRSGACPTGHVTIDRIIQGAAVLGQLRRVSFVASAAMAAWLTRAAIVWCMVHAFNLQLPLAASVTALVIVNLSIAAVAMPGNLGTFELAVAGALALWGVSPETGLSLGIAMHAVEVIPTVAIGGVTLACLG